MILDFFPENTLGDGPKNSRIRVKDHKKRLIGVRHKFRTYLWCHNFHSSGSSEHHKAHLSTEFRAEFDGISKIYSAWLQVCLFHIESQKAGVAQNTCSIISFLTMIKIHLQPYRVTICPDLV